MNCKPNDLAVVVISPSGKNLGRVVRCVRLASRAEIDVYWVDYSEPQWVIDPPLPHSSGQQKPFAPDRVLRPIRDPGDDAKDESLDWLPAPHKEVA